jgi:hypothetical protein
MARCKHNCRTTHSHTHLAVSTLKRQESGSSLSTTLCLFCSTGGSKLSSGSSASSPRRSRSIGLLHSDAKQN